MAKYLAMKIDLSRSIPHRLKQDSPESAKTASMCNEMFTNVKMFSLSSTWIVYLLVIGYFKVKQRLISDTLFSQWSIRIMIYQENSSFISSWGKNLNQAYFFVFQWMFWLGVSLCLSYVLQRNYLWLDCFMNCSSLRLNVQLEFIKHLNEKDPTSLIKKMLHC